MKNRKFISLICALSMIFTMFASFTVVNAAGKGINLAATISKDNKVITIDASATGTEGNINNFMIVLNVPENVTVDMIDAKSAVADALSEANIADGLLYVPFMSQKGAGTEFPGGKLATIKITLPEALADDFEFALQDEAGIEDQAGAIYVEDGMAASPITVVPSGKPTPKPTAATRPAPEVEPSAAPDSKPTPVAPTGKGIALASSVDKTGKIVTIDVSATGTEGNINNFMIVLNVPENVTIDMIDAKSAVADALSEANIADGLLYVPFMSQKGAGTEFPGGKLATIKITLPEAPTAPIAFTLQDEAGIEDQAGAIYVEDGMTASSTVIDPTAGEEPKYTTTQLKKFVGKGYEEAIAAVPEGKDVYLTVDVKKGAEDAVYGTDYVAEYPAGNVLSEAAYKNLIHGYTDADMADVINNLTFRVYGKGLKISTTLNAEDQPTQIVDPVVDQPIDGKTDTAKKASITVTPSRTRAVAGDGKKVTVTTKIANPSEDGVLTVKTTSDSLDCVSGSGIKVIKKDAAEDAPIVTLSTAAVTIDPTDTIEFMPAVKGTVVLSYEYKYTNNLGDADTAKNETKITISAPAVDGDDDDDDDNSSTGGSYGGGSIAHGPGSQVTTGKIAFKDLDTVPWAEDAILALVDKKVINGRSDTIFDPNGTVTRAEFAKMVVLGFDLTGGTASNFTDVATTDWFAPYVATGYNSGVISGYDDGTFRPNGLISRQEMAAMISRAIAAANKTAPATVEAVSFSDAWQIGSWAIDSVTTLQRAGIINGMTATTFEPLANATRAQAAVIINRAMTIAK